MEYKGHGNFFSLPNEIFLLCLCAEELVVYSFLRRCEDHKTHQCWPSIQTIGSAVGISENTVHKYMLGKLHLTGQEIPQDREVAWAWFYRSASQGNEYAQFFVDHFAQAQKPNILLSVTKLLHHMGQIFRQNSVPPTTLSGRQVDRKLRQKIREKKISMGHKPDDHEEEQTQGGMTMGGM